MKNIYIVIGKLAYESDEILGVFGTLKNAQESRDNIETKCNEAEFKDTAYDSFSIDCYEVK